MRPPPKTAVVNGDSGTGERQENDGGWFAPLVQNRHTMRKSFREEKLQAGTMCKAEVAACRRCGGTGPEGPSATRHPLAPISMQRQHCAPAAR